MPTDVFVAFCSGAVLGFFGACHTIFAVKKKLKK